MLVSALLSRHGSPARILTSWAQGAFELVVSPQLLAELTRVTGREAFTPNVRLAAHDLAALLVRDALVVDDPSAARVVRSDPNDDYLVALALATGAHVLVTGDRHLLDADLGAEAPRLLTPAAFLALLERLPE